MLIIHHYSKIAIVFFIINTLLTFFGGFVSIIEAINRFLGVLVPISLFSVGIYYSIKLRFFWLFHPIKITSSMLKNDSVNGISPFRAVTLALAGTLGVGNIVGVASAIALGGFGAIFWMWVSALVAMMLKYAEIVLSVSHRRTDKKGFYGGAFYYIRDLFSRIGADKSGAVLASLFAIFMIIDSFTTGNMVQINSAASSASSVFGISPIFVGISVALITFFVAITGARGVSKLTEWLIPILSLGYIVISIWVILLNANEIPTAFGQIFSSAFDFDSAVGGIFGFLTSRALRFGTMRGLLSNEAGCGSSPTAHASADAKSPAEQGFWGIFEVFVDTVILCTLTALVIIINYDAVRHLSSNGIMMAIRAYSATLGSFAEYFLSLSVTVFGLATIICRAHYGSETVRCLFGRKKRFPVFLFLILYCSVTVLGAVISPEAVMSAADLSIGAMTLINVFVLFLYRKEVFCETESFFGKNKL